MPSHLICSQDCTTAAEQNKEFERSDRLVDAKFKRITEMLIKVDVPSYNGDYRAVVLALGGYRCHGFKTCSNQLHTAREEWNLLLPLLAMA
jgi:hypothetical protein